MTNLKDRFCVKPWEHIRVQEDSTVGICCKYWVPSITGDLKKDSVMAAFNSEMSQKIRESILNGDFTYCDKEICPYIQDDSLPTRQEILKKDTVIWKGTNVATKRYKDIINERRVNNIKPLFFHLSYDESCNLSCPSCRTEKILFTKGETYEQKLIVQNKLINYLFGQPHNDYLRVNVTGSGDPFGSKLFRDLLFSIDGSKFPNVKISLQTNGIMFTPSCWEKLEKIHQNIDTVLISYDAATKDTYEIVRRGGNWEVLNNNVRFLSKLRKQRLIGHLRLDYVVQKRNYKEMPDFVSMGKALEVDKVFFNAVNNWESAELVKKGEYEYHAIWKKNHPEYHQFVEILKDPIFDDPIVDLGNITPYRVKNIQRTKYSVAKKFIGRWLQLCGWRRIQR